MGCGRPSAGNLAADVGRLMQSPRSGFVGTTQPTDAAAELRLSELLCDTQELCFIEQVDAAA